MSTDDPQRASERIRVLQQRLGEAKGRIETLRAKHHAAALMTGDRRYRTLRSIEEEIGKAVEHRDNLDRLRQEALTEGSADIRSSGKNAPQFYLRNGSYQTFSCDGHEYNLTPQAAAIVKILYEAQGKLVAGADIQSRTGCGKISDSFRCLDGPQVWKKLIQIEKGRKGFYSLHLQAFNRSQ